MNRVALVVRRSSNYENGQQCKLYSSSCQKQWSINSKVQLWNKTFSMPYFVVRKKLYEIAFGDVDSLGFDLVFRQINDETMSIVKSLSNYWIVAIDDDDWISPNLPGILRQFDSIEPMCHWGSWRFDQTSISVGCPDLKMDFRSGLEMVRSCAYAVRSFLGGEIIMNHGKTKGLKGSFLDGVHSFYVRTPASVTVLKYHPQNKINLIKMWMGMSLISEDSVPIEFRKKTILLKNLFEECRPHRILL